MIHEPSVAHEPTIEIRQLIIDHITRRQGETEDVTREGLARALAGLFWSTIEKVAPGQRDLGLPHTHP
ncbi:hypothetical protein AB0B85_28810 [Micromonospora sp. NPDC049044]|uniref:hypothetical protein n=1 Tax=unclassified Micromonospora TaxID=2617518 RepID=UPI0033E48478